MPIGKYAARDSLLAPDVGALVSYNFSGPTVRKELGFRSKLLEKPSQFRFGGKRFDMFSKKGANWEPASARPRDPLHRTRCPGS